MPWPSLCTHAGCTEANSTATHVLHRTSRQCIQRHTGRGLLRLGWAAGSGLLLGCSLSARVPRFSRNLPRAAQASIRGATGRCHAVGWRTSRSLGARSGGLRSALRSGRHAGDASAALCLQTGCTRAYSGRNDVSMSRPTACWEVLKKAAPQRRLVFAQALHAQRHAPLAGGWVAVMPLSSTRPLASLVTTA